MAAALLVVVCVGFARTFFLRPFFPAWPTPPEPVLYVHGAVFTAWFVLLVAQAWLIGTGHVRVHRRLGMAGAVLAAAMVAFGLAASIVAASRPAGFMRVPVPPLQFLIIPVGDMVNFAVLVGLGVWSRRVPQAHKRWMLLASIAIITAAIARWPGVIAGGPLLFFALSDLFLVAMIAWDYRSRGRVHPVTLWGGMALVISQPVRLALSGSAAWLACARWLTGVQP